MNSPTASAEIAKNRLEAGTTKSRLEAETTRVLGQVQDASGALVHGAIAQRSALRQRFADYCELSKARLSALVVVTTAVGYLLASDRTVDWLRLFWTVVGTSLAAAGAAAFNQVIEAGRDALMHRTQHRPVPAGRIAKAHAWTFALLTGIAGPLLLLTFVNELTASLALATELIYIFLYTPLKTRTPLNTLVGAVCGALPPMMGWTAVTGYLDTGAWLLGGVLFCWQIPHFLALAWLYREDYARGGFRMLPMYDTSGRLTCQVVVLYSLTLLPIGLLFTLTNISGWYYAAGSLLLGGLLVVLAFRLYRRRDNASARRVFHATLIYLPVLLTLMVIDRPAPRAVIEPAPRAVIEPAQPNKSAEPRAANQNPARECGAWPTTCVVGSDPRRRSIAHGYLVSIPKPAKNRLEADTTKNRLEADTTRVLG